MNNIIYPFSPEDLRALLDYDPLTGNLTWKVSRGGRKAGDPAGCVMSPRPCRCVSIKNGTYMEHRIIWYMVHGEQPATVRHRNGDQADNRLANLYRGTTSDVRVARRIFRNNTSGIVGVAYNKRTGKYRWQVMRDGIRHTGERLTMEEAVRERKAVLEILARDKTP